MTLDTIFRVVTMRAGAALLVATSSKTYLFA